MWCLHGVVYGNVLLKCWNQSTCKSRSGGTQSQKLTQLKFRQNCIISLKLKYQNCWNPNQNKTKKPVNTRTHHHSQTKESRHRPRHPRPRNANARRPDRSNDPSRWHRLRHSRPPIGPEVYIQSLAPRVPRKFPPPRAAKRRATTRGFPQFVLPLLPLLLLSNYLSKSFFLLLFPPYICFL